MKYLLLTVLLLVIPLQSEAQPCSQVSILGPGQVKQKSEPVKLRAVVSTDRPASELRFNWKVSAGNIKSGINTSEIIFELNSAGADYAEISLEVEGLPTQCPGSAKHFVTVVIECFSWAKFDEFNAAITASQELSCKGQAY
jgi:hypothetical protein